MTNAVFAILTIAMTLRRSDGKEVNVSALPVENPIIDAVSRGILPLSAVRAILPTLSQVWKAILE